MGFNNASNNLDKNSPVTLSGAADVIATLDMSIIGVDNTAAVRTVTLPAPSATGATNNLGKVYTIKDQSGGAGTNNITIAPVSGSIDGGASIAIDRNYGEAQVYSDGSAWYSSTSSFNLPLPTTDGQLIIGDTGNDPALATLTEGNGINITNGAGSITVGSDMTLWTAVLNAETFDPFDGFIYVGAATPTNFALPATNTIGNVIEITVRGTGTARITQAAGQQIRFGNQLTTAGVTGSITSTQTGDSIKLVCAQNTGLYIVLSSVGNWVLV